MAKNEMQRTKMTTDQTQGVLRVPLGLVEMSVSMNADLDTQDYQKQIINDKQ